MCNPPWVWVPGAGSMGSGLAQVAARVEHAACRRHVQVPASERVQLAIAAGLDGSISRRSDLGHGSAIVLEDIAEALVNEEALPLSSNSNTSSVSVTAIAVMVQHLRRMATCIFDRPRTAAMVVARGDSPLLSAMLQPSSEMLVEPSKVAGLEVMRTLFTFITAAATLSSWEVVRSADIDAAMRLKSACQRGALAWGQIAGASRGLRCCGICSATTAVRVIALLPSYSMHTGVESSSMVKPQVTVVPNDHEGAQRRAKRLGRRMSSHEPQTRALATAIVDVGPGSARVRMTVSRDMRNGFPSAKAAFGVIIPSSPLRRRAMCSKPFVTSKRPAAAPACSTFASQASAANALRGFAAVLTGSRANG